MGSTASPPISLLLTLLVMAYQAMTKTNPHVIRVSRLLRILFGVKQTDMSYEKDADLEEPDTAAEEEEDVAEEPLKQISIAVQQGQRRRIMKGMQYNTDEKHGYIYMVRTREFKSLNRPIYKVGKTSQCPDTRITRLHKYTKGSEIYLILQCHVADVSLIEKEILEAFCHRWDPGPDGSEDFIIPTPADLLSAKQFMIEVITRFESARVRLSAPAPSMSK